MKAAFLQNIEKKKLFNKHDRLLLGVSGGRDSMTLAHLLESCGFAFAVAHCNFQLRGEEANKEEAFVTEYFSKKNIPVFAKRFNTKLYSEENHCSIQMAARELRYQWFHELKEKEGFDYIVTAHHSSDNLETFFINLTRGAGIKGLGGIPEKTKDVVRPLLFASREEIDEYINEHTIPFCEDSSNAEEKYLRNKLRHQLIPLLKELNPSIEETLSREMLIIRQVQSLQEKVLSKELTDICKKEGNNTLINANAILTSDYPELLLHEALKDFDFHNEIIFQIKECIEQGLPGKQFKSATHHLVIDRSAIIVRPLQKEEKQKSFDIPENGISQPIQLHFQKKEGQHIIKSDNSACLDLDKLSFPLQLCKWQEGDYFVPLGMKGRKKLSDFFVSEKMSLFDKEDQWLLKSGTEIVWVVGRRTDERFKVNESTKNTLIIEWKK